MTRRTWAVLGIGAVLIGCSSGGGSSRDPLTTLRDPEKKPSVRVRAADAAWEQALAGEQDPRAVRETLKALAWPRATPTPIRARALEIMLSDPDPERAQDARDSVRLMLANERDRTIVGLICTHAARNGWTDYTTSIVRSFSHPVARVKDDQRAEYKALRALHPDRPVPEVVFGVFLEPDVEDGPYGIDWPARARADAWDLLTRLDPAGRYRWRLIDGLGAGAAGSDLKEVADLRACVREFHCLPVTSQELQWLTALRDPNRAGNLGWWSESSAVVGRLSPEQREGLSLRHIEAVRWSTRHRRVWADASRDELLTILRERLSARTTHRRTNGVPPDHRESIDAWDERLGWADLVAILAVDDAVRSGIAGDLFTYAERDRADTTTEYGGIIEARGSTFAAVLYPPRASVRRGDNEFVASDDMIEASDLALAHFHLQVQEERNSAFAGPSRGDLIYAARSGRTCVVFTSIDADTLNVDVYQPDGVVIDLGEITR